MSSRFWLRIGFLVAGLAVLAAALAAVDVRQVLDLLPRIGWGFAAILALYALGFAADIHAWHLALPSFPQDLAHHFRLYRIRMIGELVNHITPLLGGLAGEPVKALILKRRYGVSVREAAASLIVAKTVILLALVAFMALGFGLLLGQPGVPGTYVAVAGAGLAAFAVAILAFFLVQRFRVASRLGAWFRETRFGRRVAGVLHDIQDVDDRLIGFYVTRPRRFALAFLMALVAWVLGAVEVFLAATLMGGSIDFTQALVIEAVAQMVRAGLFFIPASIGVQEGAFVLLFEVLTGNAALGLAVALVRRGRDLVWLAVSGVLAWGEGWREVSRLTAD